MAADMAAQVSVIYPPWAMEATMPVLRGLRVRCGMCKKTSGVQAPPSGETGVFEYNDELMRERGWFIGRVFPWTRRKQHICPACVTLMIGVVHLTAQAIELVRDDLEAA